MKDKTRIIFFLLVIFLATSADLVTKSLTSDYLERYPEKGVTIIPGVLKFTFTINTGVIAGTFKGKNTFWIVCGLLAIMVFLYVFFSTKDAGSLFTAGIALVIAGALGNVFDRMLYSGVRDFINLYTIGWPIFNLADAYLTIGAVVICGHYLAEEVKKRKGVREEEKASA
jgi:signal peptidase II